MKREKSRGRRNSGDVENFRERRVKALSALEKGRKVQERRLSEGAQWVNIDDRTRVLKKKTTP